MSAAFSLHKILQFFLVRILIGVIVIAGCVALVETAGRFLLDKTSLSFDIKNVVIAFGDASIALVSYTILFRLYEKRKISELNTRSFLKYAVTGFAIGFVLQSMFVVIIYLLHGYKIIHVNQFSYLLPALSASVTAGFVAEIIIIGIIFRITEKALGSVTTLALLFILFAILHISAKATIISVLTTAMQAGIMLSAAYMCTRSLWLPIFIHFAWDFAEPGIYGGINPGNSIDQSLLDAKIIGAHVITGGQNGPQNSIQALVICSIASILFLWIAKRTNNFLHKELNSTSE